MTALPHGNEGVVHAHEARGVAALQDYTLIHAITLQQLSSLNCTEASKEFEDTGAKAGIWFYPKHTSLRSLS